jgi:hypothetical protein
MVRTMSGRAKLKLGLLLNSFDVPAWQSAALSAIVKSGVAEFVVVVLGDAANGTTHSDNSRFAYEVFNKLDEAIFCRAPNALTRVSLGEILAGVPVVMVTPTREASTDSFRAEDITRLRDYDLDVIVNIGFRRLQGEVLAAARFGVWYYEHGDNRVARGGPPGFWEVIERRPETGSALCLANDAFPNGWVIYRSRFLTYPFSPARNRQTSFWASSSFLSRQVKRLYALGWDGFLAETGRFNSDFDFYDHPRHHVPSNLASLQLYSRLAARQLLELSRRVLCKDKWCLFFALTNDRSLSFEQFKKLAPPRDRFWADPNVIRRGDRYFVFVEEYPYHTRKGHIAVIEMDSEGHHRESIPVLERDYHLSYPFVFDYDNKYYMVPESAENRSIDIYECGEFPRRWNYKMTLMDNVKAVDSTLFHHEGKWWLFTALAEHEGAFPEVELFLFYSESLLTTRWTPHPLNPIVSDVTTARPAGRLFLRDGRVYRPSQDCSRSYGYGFNINEVVCLSEAEYVEKTVAAVKPHWDRRLSACHTYSSAGGLVVIDGLYRAGKLT